MSDLELPVADEPERIRREYGALLKERDAADLLGTEVRTLQAWRHSGTGPPYVKLGGAPNAPVRYPAAQLREFLRRNTVISAPAGGAIAPATPAGAIVESPRRLAAAPPKPAGAAAPAPARGITALRTVKRLAEELRDSGITLAALRWYLFNGDRNGLNASGAVVRPPGCRRVLIDREKFERWLRSRTAPEAERPERPLASRRT